MSTFTLQVYLKCVGRVIYHYVALKWIKLVRGMVMVWGNIYNIYTRNHGFSHDNSWFPWISCTCSLQRWLSNWCLLGRKNTVIIAMKNWKLSPKEPWRLVAGKIYLSIYLSIYLFIYLSIYKWFIFQLKPSLSTASTRKMPPQITGKHPLRVHPDGYHPQVITKFLWLDGPSKIRVNLWPCKIPHSSCGTDFD